MVFETFNTCLNYIIDWNCLLKPLGWKKALNPLEDATDILRLCSNSPTLSDVLPISDAQVSRGRDTIYSPEKNSVRLHQALEWMYYFCRLEKSGPPPWKFPEISAPLKSNPGFCWLLNITKSIDNESQKVNVTNGIIYFHISIHRYIYCFSLIYKYIILNAYHKLFWSWLDK